MFASSFEELKDRDQHFLETVIETGDAPERVWASWALAIRLGGDFNPTIDPAREPDPGVRAHLVIVLAGIGRHAAVRTLAAGDPDPR